VTLEIVLTVGAMRSCDLWLHPWGRLALGCHELFPSLEKVQMATLFTKIIEGDLPGEFVWKDECCVAFLSIAPLNPGHTLVVPRVETEHWIDLDPDVVGHIFQVTQSIGKAMEQEYAPVKVGTIVLGLEVPHVHVHVVPVWSPTDLDFHNAKAGTPPETLAREAVRIRGALVKLGYSQVAE
jgi:histidine triad (HIT) family protein